MTDIISKKLKQLNQYVQQNPPDQSSQHAQSVKPICGGGKPCRISRISPEDAGLYDGISEMIVVTGGKNPNVAPIGVIYRNGRLFLRLFYGSRTCENLKTENYFTGCVTTDPFVFARSCFENPVSEYCEQNYYEVNSSLMEFPSLKSEYAQRITLFRCVSRTESEIALLIDIEPVVTIVTQSGAKQAGTASNRGFNAIVEACVDLTRFRFLDSEKEPEVYQEYIDRLVRCQGIVRRCGRPEDKEAFLMIRQKMLEYSERFEKSRDSAAPTNSSASSTSSASSSSSVSDDFLME